MDDLLKPVKTTKKIKHNIEKFESLALRGDASSDIENVTSRKPRPVIEVNEEGDETEITLRPRATTIIERSEPSSAAEYKRSPQLQQTLGVNKNKRDSTAFLRRTYLGGPTQQISTSEPEGKQQLISTTSPEAQTSRSQSGSSPKTTTTSGKSLADDAKEILRSQPSREDLNAVLEYLYYGIKEQHDYNIKVASPQSAQLINVLVTVTLPDLWPIVNPSIQSGGEYVAAADNELRTKKILLECLSCTAGIGALLAQIQQYCSQSRSQSATTTTMQAQPNHLTSARIRIKDLLSVLSDILRGPKWVYSFLTNTKNLYFANDLKRKMSWNEIVGLTAGGRILGLAAEAIALLSAGPSLETNSTLVSNRSDEDGDIAWLGDGARFTSWLGKNISFACVKAELPENEYWVFLAHMTKRGLSLGNRDVLVSELYTSLLLGKKALWTPLRQLLAAMSDYEQKLIFDTILLDVSKKCLGGASSLAGFHENHPAINKAISASAALVSGLVKDNQVLEQYLEEWLVVANSSYAAVGLATRRALIATLATAEGKLERILERALSNFADKLQIQHASSIQQDAYTQTILLAIGYLKRTNVTILKDSSISSLVMRSVSNRLSASIPHSRLLGMIVGVANSRATDAPEKVLNFDIEEMETEQAQSWLKIPDIQDSVADESEISSLFSSQLTTRSTVSKHVAKPKKVDKPIISTPKSEIISIEEVTGTASDEEDEDEDEDLIPYAKPDSDPEDSDDDPTLINRSKPSAPVYIIDLIRQLETKDKPDVVELALRTAPGLIRRKTGFGTELSDNLNSLTTSLVNLQEEGFSLSHELFENLRLESIVLCVLAKPASIAPSLVTLYFEGDFSISQRVLLLTALGLSARELAGFQTIIGQNLKKSTAKTGEEFSFPSKRLPPHLQQQHLEKNQKQQQRLSQGQHLKALSQNPISALTLSQAQSTIQPMALAAADKITGPSALKIRTFSSRMDVKRKRKENQEARTKRVPKDLYVLLTKCYYLPLCARLNLLVSSGIAAGSRGKRLNTTTLFPSLMRMSLQTLTLTLHTLGPSASLHLPTLTHETLLLLLSLHASTHLGTDPIVLPTLLHLLLALLDVTIEAGHTAQERLIVDHGEQIAELVRWANDLGNNNIAVPEMNSRGGEELAGEGEIPWSVLVAGIQVKWFEMGQRFQGRMLGLTD